MGTLAIVGALGAMLVPAGALAAAPVHYTLSLPKGWVQVSPNSVAPGQHAFAAVRQKTGVGVVVMQLEGKVSLNGSYASNLEAQLSKAVSDYKLLAAQTLKLKEGSALDVTYERTSLKQVRNVVVLPYDNHSIVFATIAAVGDKNTTSQISEIVDSFRIG